MKCRHYLSGLLQAKPVKKGLTSIGPRSNFRAYAHYVGAGMNQCKGFQRTISSRLTLSRSAVC